MRVVTAFLSALLVSTSLLLTGCGGGVVVEGEVVVPPAVVVVSPPPQRADAFDLIMFANGQQVGGVNVFPNKEQDVYLPVGSNFELASSGPVAWTVVTGGRVVNPPVNGTLVYAGINLTPTRITNARYAANTIAAGLLPNPVVVSFIATSLDDPSQVAQINIVLTN
jgi:hypothetical protein